MLHQIPCIKNYGLAILKGSIVVAILCFAAIVHGRLCLWASCIGVLFFWDFPPRDVPAMWSRFGYTGFSLPFLWKVVLGVGLIWLYQPPSRVGIVIMALLTKVVVLSPCIQITVRTKRFLTRHA